ncbi:hypothetical protein [Alteromonas sp. C1M14]|uniref:hypothetical protein n=1 Tax=Alteromonas sp. C1M14 TaxID=2841567 RepID=UPI001C089F37|nr:hypothetical protein [Alteromonas sp. C1M14]MBU2976619.1 hypothetical protein [Alteromonas sp. C1M14]
MKTELERVLVRKGHQVNWLFITLATSSVTLFMLFGYTWLNFDALYEPYKSAYPRLSTVFSPVNMTVLSVLALTNGITFYRLKQTKAHLAVTAYMVLLENKPDTLTNQFYPQLQQFFHAAGLPDNYSLVSLKKMNMRHFITLSSPISRTVTQHQNQWIRLAHAAAYGQPAT